ncbi:TetR/AcrR family transcriptional regulator [Novosphingobium sp.]|uniref:TetR/AcrR family transcriptional regulator n=1 Tax=Novosphingobium sp. TaxID=1874826 RepID=UPI0025E4BF21|nr:TetR/AcrR family transcriptional regulator [Novosphingobium sp.]MCC6927062.1 TetR/AcrR family transcriptional regulator [Novosphingobium sp.]
MSSASDQWRGLTPTKLARRERIVDAAERTFARIGLKAATMESIAEAAGVSKATLYAYFPDKFTVYVTVAERLAEQMIVEARTALVGPGSCTDRIARALIVKHGLAFELVVASPNAAELLATKHNLVGETFARIDTEIEQTIAQLLADRGERDAAAIARTVFNASIGIGERATNRLELESDIRRLVERLCG